MFLLDARFLNSYSLRIKPLVLGFSFILAPVELQEKVKDAFSTNIKRNHEKQLKGCSVCRLYVVWTISIAAQKAPLATS